MNELNNIQTPSLKQAKKHVFTHKNHIFSKLQKKNKLFRPFSLFQVLVKYHYFRYSVWPT